MTNQEIDDEVENLIKSVRTPKRGYHAVNVREFVNRHGKVVRAHVRITKKKYGPRKSRIRGGLPRDPISHRRIDPVAVKLRAAAKQPKPDVSKHAQHLYEQLNVPMALLLGMKQATPASQTESEFQTRAMISRALIAINEARVFINRFTTPQED